MFDLRITGGQLLIPGTGIVQGDIGVAEGRIAAITAPGGLPETSGEHVDAGGALVTPGIIDPHVHLGPHVPFDQDVEHETRAASAGGITTLGCFTHSEGSYHEALPELERTVDELSSVDMFFHPIMSQERHLEELESYVESLGIWSFKAYMSEGASGFVDDDYLLRLFERVAALDVPGIVCVHAENDALMKGGTRRLREEGGGSLAAWDEARPDHTEEEAVIRAAYLAEISGCDIYIVHMSSGRAARRAEALRRDNRHLRTETVTHYLSLTRDHPLGTLVKRKPPLRSGEDVDALWRGVDEGVIDVIGTDNVVGSRQINDPEAGVLGAKVGFTMLGTHLPVALHEGYHRRGVQLERLIAAMTEVPARLFGLYPRKGSLSVGADADITVIDLEEERVVDHRDLYTWSDFSPWDGETLKGWPIYTVLGGNVVMEHGEVRSQPGVGQAIRRGDV